ncbi:alpha/beta hydrolase family protein [Gordonia hydrophobica]|uniref:Alpha/beta hydrolase fold domain-containing protein n=1 Tax=Gordonia hydrophobica TaxID=40516 RepID=A0ABZ2U641_9ACTN|nr:alpha/beta hydrolase fold domain-containing protein [Gordonia hydrophobica]MBM7365497.1 acetyl esterase/lipase [Gordonia hydrophobica]
MKLPRPHPLVSATLSTALVAIACAVVLIWGSIAPAPRPAADQTDPHDAANVAATHADHAHQNGPTRRIHYPTRSADPRQNYADLSLPADYARRTDIPVVVLVHGGSWASTVSARSFDRLAGDLTARGVAVYNVEYRRIGSGGGWPTTFSDVGAALDELPVVAAEYPRLDLARSVLVGHSAGAQLVAWAGLRTAEQPGPGLGAPTWTPRRIVSVSGPLDLAWSATHGDSRVVRALGGTPSEVAARYRAVDPVHLAARGSAASGPELIVLHGTSDRVVPDVDSVRFVAEYRAHGGRADLRLLSGQTHSSMFRAHSKAYQSLVQTIVDAADAP